MKKRRTGKPVGWDDELWALRFAELREYREKHGHVLVPANWRENVQLGRWLAYQRQQARRGLIEPNRWTRLEELGVQRDIIREPKVEEHDLYMAKMLARLDAYRRKHGHMDVRDEEDHALAYWIGRQRIYRNAGTLRKYRRELLDAAGFPWKAVDRRWEERFWRLVRFEERFGQTAVPRRWKEDEALGRWVEHQRARYRNGTLSGDFQRRLRKLGFRWEIPEAHVAELDVYLDKMLARLIAYRKRYGHACVLRSRDRALAMWIQRQRYYHSTGVLKEYRRKRMDAAGFPWEPVRHQWEEKFSALQEFKARHGHTWVPAKSKEHPVLGSWVAFQRQMFKAGKLSAERQRRLEELGFQWVINQDFLRGMR